MQQQLYVYNTLTRQQERFQPIAPPHVGMYVCGPTVYGPAHLGHARCYLTFDTIKRYMQHIGYKVRYVRNITDVGHLERDADEGEDKILQQARLEKIEPIEVVQRYTHSFHRDIAALNIEAPDIEPTASGHIPEQIALIEKMLQQGWAYEVEGSVYFNIKSYEQHHHYGELSGRKLEDVLTGTRALKSQAEKKSPVDFALWKKADATHIMRWPSPWGEGFPGWHTECAVLACKYLGNYFDIHGGGMDLVFPHHECELVQARAIHHTTSAKYWIHNNVVTLHNQKMSKSLGNYITLAQLFQGTNPLLTRPYHAMILRFFYLQAHYRSTVNFSNEALHGAEKSYLKLMNGLKAIQGISYTAEAMGSGKEEVSIASIEQHIALCYGAMNDDFNTAKLIAALFRMLKLIHALENRSLAIEQAAFEKLKQAYTLFVEDILGLQNFFQAKPTDLMATIMRVYETAKQQKNYPQVDMLRAELKNQGIALKDTRHGATWEYGEYTGA